MKVRFVSCLSLLILLLAILSNAVVFGIWLPPRIFPWVSATGSVSTYGSDPAQGWLRVFANPNDSWVKGWSVFSVPPLGSHGFWYNPPSYNFTLYVARMVNASIVEQDCNGSYFFVRGFWEVNNMTNPSAPSEVFGLVHNMTLTSGELNVTSNWSSFTINIEGYESIQGSISSYFAGELEAPSPLPYYPYVDYNDDGIIEMRDIGMIARCYGATLTRIGYPFMVDINFDFKVDMKDIGLCARVFGTGPVVPLTV